MGTRRAAFTPYFWIPVLSVLSIAPSAWPQTAPTKVEETETAALGPTEDEVSDWIARVEASTLDEDAKQGLRDSYAATLGFVQALSKSQDRTTQLDELRTNAPKRLTEEVEPALQQPSVAMPTPDPDATLASMESQANQARAAKDIADNNGAALEEERRKRNENRADNPAATQVAVSRISEIERDLESIEASTDVLDPSFARRERLLSERRHLKQRLLELKAEITSYDARSELLNRRIELAVKRRTDANTLANHWSEVVSAKRQAEAADAAKIADDSQKNAEEQGFVALKAATKRNLELANLRTGEDSILALTKSAASRLVELETERDTLKLRFELDRKRVETIGLSDALGQYLHSSRRLVFGASTVEDHLEEIRQRESELKSVVLRQIEFDEEERSYSNIERNVRAGIEEVETEDPVELRKLGTELTEAYQELRSNLIKVQEDHVQYLTQLNELDARQKALVALGEEYREYLNEKVLWIRSSSAIGVSTFTEAGRALRSFTDPYRLRDLAFAFPDDFRGRWPNYVVTAGIIVLLRIARRRLSARRARQKTENPKLRSPILPVLLASFEAVVRAAPIPIALWFIARRGYAATLGWPIHDHATILSTGLKVVAGFLFMIGVLLQILRSRGLAEQTFGWPADSIRSARLTVRSLASIGLPIVFIYGCFGPEHAYGDSLGRLAFLALLVIGPLFAWKLRAPFESIVADMRGEPGKASGAWGQLYMITAIWMPLFLAGLAAWGYYWTATQLAQSLTATGWLILLLVFAFTVVNQWFQYHRRLIAQERLRKRREEVAQQPTPNESQDDARSEALAAIPSEPDEIDLRKANEQTRSMLRNGAVVLFLLGLWAIWGDVLPALRVLDQVKLWTVHVNDLEVDITLVNLLLGVSFLILTMIISINVTGFLDLVVLTRLPLEPGSRYAVVTLVRYGIGATGIALALGAVGLNWGDLQWLVAALMVGLGFGLQEIFGNLVSGLILLLERPVRVGDTVTVNGTTGLVTRIRMRATTISDWDRKELIIPNKSFITNDIVNWSLTDPIVRLVLPIGVAYGTDVKKAEDLLLKAAREDRDVLADPAPNVVFQAFGDSSLNLDLRVFVPNIDRMVPARHSMNRAINTLFEKNGIEIPFPQRDVHMHIETESDGVVTVRPAPIDSGQDRA